MPTTLEIKRRFLGVFPEPQAEILSEVITSAYNDLVKTSDFNELKWIVKDIGLKVGELAKAQERTELKVGELAKAQERTELKVGELAEAQKESQKEIGRLDRTMQELVTYTKNLATEVGSLSTTVGFSIEDIAKVVLPGYLQRHYGIEVEELERRFFDVEGRTEPIEIDIYGEGKRNGKEVVIIGESKSKIYGREVEGFIDTVNLIRGNIHQELYQVMFGFYIHPSATKAGKERGIILVASYQR